jgi:hypothetical protein
VPQSRITLSVRPILLAVPLLCVGVVLAGCAGGSSTASPAASQSGSASAGQQNRLRQFPGATGELAAITGSTLQVQGTSTQTAVTYTQTTKISDTVAATYAAVKVGVCVEARAARSDASSSASASDETTTVAAATVVVTQPVNGECAAEGAGSGGQFGGRPSGGASGGFTPTGSTRPSGAPSGSAQRRAGFGANGKVVSVSGASFVVASVRLAPSASAGASASPTTSDVTVTTNASTTYSQTVSATASALKVGTCVTALGKADDTGAIAATAISVRPKSDGTCGFGGGGPNG